MLCGKKLFKTIFLFAVILSWSSQAQALEQKPHMLTLGPAVSYITYEEDNAEETGFLYGVVGNYTYRGELLNGRFPAAMLRIDGRLMYGEIEFDGRLFDGNTYTIDGVENFIAEFRGTAGYDFPAFTSTTVTPYLGLGYRYLSDDTSKDNAGYRRKANYFYTPIGVETRTPLAEGWLLGFNLEYDLFWFGRQETYLSDLDPLFSDLTNDQHDGYGLKVSIRIYKTAEDKNFIFEPYLYYWDIDRSEAELYKHTGVVGGTYTEPANTSTEFGLKVMFEY